MRFSIASFLIILVISVNVNIGPITPNLGLRASIILESKSSVTSLSCISMQVPEASGVLGYWKRWQAFWRVRVPSFMRRWSARAGGLQDLLASSVPLGDTVEGGGVGIYIRSGCEIVPDRRCVVKMDSSRRHGFPFVSVASAVFSSGSCPASFPIDRFSLIPSTSCWRLRAPFR